MYHYLTSQYSISPLSSHNMYQYSLFFSGVRESIQDGTFEAKATLFSEVFGSEPERTGEKHEAQIAVEAALQKRNQRLETAEEGVVGAIGGAVPAGQQVHQTEDAEHQASKKKRPSQEVEEGVDIAAKEKALKK